MSDDKRDPQTFEEFWAFLMGLDLFFDKLDDDDMEDLNAIVKAAWSGGAYIEMLRRQEDARLYSVRMKVIRDEFLA